MGIKGTFYFEVISLVSRSSNASIKRSASKHRTALVEKHTASIVMSRGHGAKATCFRTGHRVLMLLRKGWGGGQGKRNHVGYYVVCFHTLLFSW